MKEHKLIEFTINGMQTTWKLLPRPIARGKVIILPSIILSQHDHAHASNMSIKRPYCDDKRNLNALTYFKPMHTPKMTVWSLLSNSLFEACFKKNHVFPFLAQTTPPHACGKYTRLLKLKKKQETIPVSTPEYLNRFRSVFTLITMM